MSQGQIKPLQTDPANLVWFLEIIFFDLNTICNEASYNRYGEVKWIKVYSSHRLALVFTDRDATCEWSDLKVRTLLTPYSPLRLVRRRGMVWYQYFKLCGDYKQFLYFFPGRANVCACSRPIVSLNKFHLHAPAVEDRSKKRSCLYS